MSDTTLFFIAIVMAWTIHNIGYIAMFGLVVYAIRKLGNGKKQ